MSFLGLSEWLQQGGKNNGSSYYINLEKNKSSQQCKQIKTQILESILQGFLGSWVSKNCQIILINIQLFYSYNEKHLTSLSPQKQ